MSRPRDRGWPKKPIDPASVRPLDRYPERDRRKRSRGPDGDVFAVIVTLLIALLALYRVLTGQRWL